MMQPRTYETAFRTSPIGPRRFATGVFLLPPFNCTKRRLGIKRRFHFAPVPSDTRQESSGAGPGARKPASAAIEARSSDTQTASSDVKKRHVERRATTGPRSNQRARTSRRRLWRSGGSTADPPNPGRAGGVAPRFVSRAARRSPRAVHLVSHVTLTAAP